jgi:hypothetical protein
MPALTGDVTTVAGSVATTLAAVGTPGTYAKVTRDSKGRVTAGALLVPADLPSHAEVSLRNQTTNASGNLAPGGGIAPAGMYAFHAYIWPSVLGTGGNILVTLAWHDGSGPRSYGPSLSCAFTGNIGASLTIVTAGASHITYVVDKSGCTGSPQFGFSASIDRVGS